MSDPNGTTGDESYDPGSWGVYTTDDNAEQTTEQKAKTIPNQNRFTQEFNPDRFTQIQFPNANLREYWGIQRANGDPWPMTCKVVPRKTASGEEDASNPHIIPILRGVVRVERIHQYVSLTELRTKEIPERYNPRYTYRIQMGDDESEPLVGSVQESAFLNYRDNHVWLQALRLPLHVHQKSYGDVRTLLLAKVKHAKLTGMQCEDVFQETGMYRAITESGEQLVFLTPGENGAIGPTEYMKECQTELTSSIRKRARFASLGYQYPNDEIIAESFAELFKMYDVTEENKAIPVALLGVNALAVMYGIHEHAHCVVNIIGESKQMKTTLACLLIPNQSPTERGRNVEPTINARLARGNGSTPYGMSQVLPFFGGFVIIVDDVATKKQIQNENDRNKTIGNAEALTTQLENGAPLKGGRDKHTGEIGLAEDSSPKTSFVFTMEAFPEGEEYASIFNRMVNIYHTGADDVNLPVLCDLQTPESGSLRHNALNLYVRELTRSPEFFNNAWDEAGRITDGWKFANFERERHNYRKILTGNIALINAAKKLGVKKLPSVKQIAEWLYQAAKKQFEKTEQNFVNSTEEPLDIFRRMHAELLRGRWGSYRMRGRKGEKATLFMPFYEDKPNLGSLEWHHLGWFAGSAKVDGDGESLTDIELNSEKIKPRSDNPMGLFIADGRSGKNVPAKLGKTRFQYSTSEFDDMLAEMTTRAKRQGFVLPNKLEMLTLLKNEGVYHYTPVKSEDRTKSEKVHQIDAEWLSRVGEDDEE